MSERVFWDEASIAAALATARREARDAALEEAEAIASDFAGEVWDCLRPQAHEAAEVIEARIRALRSGEPRP